MPNKYLTTTNELPLITTYNINSLAKYIIIFSRAPVIPLLCWGIVYPALVVTFMHGGFLCFLKVEDHGEYCPHLSREWEMVYLDQVSTSTSSPWNLLLALQWVTFSEDTWEADSFSCLMHFCQVPSAIPQPRPTCANPILYSGCKHCDKRKNGRFLKAGSLKWSGPS